jgi:hypothetical protein
VSSYEKQQHQTMKKLSENHFKKEFQLIRDFTTSKRS